MHKKPRNSFRTKTKCLSLQSIINTKKTKENMKCPYCSKELRDDAKFCDNCGKELLKACPWEDCADYGKATLHMRDKLCPRCGRPLQEKVEQN